MTTQDSPLPQVAAWAEPSAPDMMRAMIAVLTDIIPSDCRVVFLHGTPVRDDKLDQAFLGKAAKAYENDAIDTIVINGFTRADCLQKNLSYAGHEPWVTELVRVCGVDFEDIIIIPPSAHTGAESRNLLKLAKERDWKKFAVSSHPFHQLRCFLTTLAVMDEPEVDYHPAVYNMVGPRISWDHPMNRLAMGGQTVHGIGDTVGTVSQLVDGEFQRIRDYSKEPPVVDGKKKFTRNATIPEMLKYLETRP